MFMTINTWFKLESIVSRFWTFLDPLQDMVAALEMPLAKKGVQRTYISAFNCHLQKQKPPGEFEHTAYSFVGVMVTTKPTAIKGGVGRHIRTEKPPRRFVPSLLQYISHQEKKETQEASPLPFTCTTYILPRKKWMGSILDQYLFPCVAYIGPTHSSKNCTKEPFS
ncbi:hypothetical protein VNO77_01792 [Canavalia gladiata]|uniref:Uncharacterized protein n=1 Tax=Canavalia gladiata TaxID=3824 RepID=A0AAN9MX25_CANGL